MSEVAFNPPGHPGYGPRPVPPPPPSPGATEAEPRGYEIAVPSYETPVTMPVVQEQPDNVPVSPASPPSQASSSGRVGVAVVDRFGNNARRGSTKIPTEVMEKIVTRLTSGVPGVHGFSETYGDDGDRALAIELDGKVAVVRLRLVIEYGFAVYPVTDKIRAKLISALENLFGLDVTAIDIEVTDIYFAEPDAEEA